MSLSPSAVGDVDMSSELETLLASSLHRPDLITKFHAPRFKQRLSTIRAWGVREGEKILDIGCGQGESCLALALEVGKSGHVTAIDPAQLDYGYPFTMREAHDHIKNSVLGPRISFYPVDATSFLGKQDQHPDSAIDSAVLCHSLWYFENEEDVQTLFTTLARAKIPRLYLAEWSYIPSQEGQIPHILAAKVQALFYRYKKPCQPGLREQNVRSGADHKSLLKAASNSGFFVARETVITPAEDMVEGQFEVNYVLGKQFQQRLAQANLAKEKEAEIHELIQQLRSEMERSKSTRAKTIASMDVWCAVLELEQ
jgi:SAM-dependent methyltransferase